MAQSIWISSLHLGRTQVYLIPYFQSPFTCPLIRGVRNNMGLWYSNGLHQIWCCTPSCYTINNACTCRLCGERQPTKSHLLSCRTSTLARHIVITPLNVDVCNVEQCLCNVDILSTLFLIMIGYDLMCTFYILARY